MLLHFLKIVNRVAGAIYDQKFYKSMSFTFPLDGGYSDLIMKCTLLRDFLILLALLFNSQ